MVQKMSTKLNMSFLYNPEVVVHVKTMDEARSLAEAVQKHFPHLMNNARVESIVNSWKKYGDDTVFRFDYARYDELDEREIVHFGFCYTKWYNTRFHKIVEFEELLTIDLGSFSTGYETKSDALLSLFE